MSEETPKTETTETHEHQHFQLPPASFGELVFTLRLQAEMHLGLMPGGEEEKDQAGPDLPVAQHYIDLLGILSEKTKGNLPIEEQRYLENSLTELRFRYVQAASEQKPK
jgi:hypothetical protein